MCHVDDRILIKYSPGIGALLPTTTSKVYKNLYAIFAKGTDYRAGLCTAVACNQLCCMHKTLLWSSL